MEIEFKKESASNWFKALRDSICKSFEELDNSAFERKTWNHKGTGGGERIETVRVRGDRAGDGAGGRGTRGGGEF